jgi:UDP-N-acetylmuramoyl-L-alanyl-D-glutamate--2,6-diaminopimelate ligase
MGLVAREWFGRPDASLTLVGITGTKGKTTVTYLVESIASAAGRKTGRIGTVGYAYAGHESAATRTTPEATDLYALLARMRDASVSVVAMEVSSHALALHRVAGARFPVAAFLNLGRDHLEFHGSREAYFEAKASLFSRLEAGDVAVLPADDPLGSVLAERTAARVVRFGRGGSADVRIVEERSGLSGSTVTLATSEGTIEIATPLLGRFNVDNIAAATACAVALGLPAGAIRAGVAALRSVPGRLEPVERGQPFAVLVDYAHTEESLAAVLDAVRPLTPGRLAVVFGCGGDRDRAKRPRMGRAAAERADLLFLTSDNPRSEDPAVILREIEAGVASFPGASTRARVIEDRSAAIAAAIGERGPATRSSLRARDTRRPRPSPIARSRSTIAWSRAPASRRSATTEAPMPALSVGDLLQATGGRLVIGDPASIVTSYSIDTRRLERGAAFFALAGTRTDGHAFVPDAARAGAGARRRVPASRGHRSVPSGGPSMWTTEPRRSPAAAPSRASA